MSMTARAPVPTEGRQRDCKRYRYTFLRHDEERAVAAFELFLGSEDSAYELAKVLLDRSEAELVEVWSDGHMLLRLVKTPAPHTRAAPNLSADNRQNSSVC